MSCRAPWVPMTILGVIFMIVAITGKE